MCCLDASAARQVTACGDLCMTRLHTENPGLSSQRLQLRHGFDHEGYTIMVEVLVKKAVVCNPPYVLGWFRH